MGDSNNNGIATTNSDEIHWSCSSGGGNDGGEEPQLEEPLLRLQLAEPLLRLQQEEPLLRLQQEEPLLRLQLAEPLCRLQLAEPLRRLQLAEPLRRLQLAEPLRRLQLAEPLRRLQLAELLRRLQPEEQQRDIRDRALEAESRRSVEVERRRCAARDQDHAVRQEALPLEQLRHEQRPAAPTNVDKSIIRLGSIYNNDCNNGNSSGGTCTAALSTKTTKPGDGKYNHCNNQIRAITPVVNNSENLSRNANRQFSLDSSEKKKKRRLNPPYYQQPPPQNPCNLTPLLLKPCSLTPLLELEPSSAERNKNDSNGTNSPSSSNSNSNNPSTMKKAAHKIATSTKEAARKVRTVSVDDNADTSNSQKSNETGCISPELDYLDEGYNSDEDSIIDVDDESSDENKDECSTATVPAASSNFSADLDYNLFTMQIITDNVSREILKPYCIEAARLSRVHNEFKSLLPGLHHELDPPPRATQTPCVYAIINEKEPNKIVKIGSTGNYKKRLEYYQKNEKDQKYAGHIFRVILDFDNVSSEFYDKFSPLYHEVMGKLSHDQNLHDTQRAFYSALYEKGGDLLGPRRTIMLRMLEYGFQLYYEIAAPCEAFAFDQVTHDRCYAQCRLDSKKIFEILIDILGPGKIQTAWAIASWMPCLREGQLSSKIETIRAILGKMFADNWLDSLPFPACPNATTIEEMYSTNYTPEARKEGRKRIKDKISSVLNSKDREILYVDTNRVVFEDDKNCKWRSIHEFLKHYWKDLERVYDLHNEIFVYKRLGDSNHAIIVHGPLCLASNSLTVSMKDRVRRGITAGTLCNVQRLLDGYDTLSDKDDYANPIRAMLFFQMQRRYLHGGLCQSAAFYRFAVRLDDSSNALKDHNMKTVKEPVPRSLSRKKCSVSGCDKFCQQGGLCIKHGAKKPSRKKCSFSGCDKLSRQGGLCMKHGAKRKKCSFSGCDKLSRQGGLCIKHGAKRKKCSFSGCDKFCVQGGLCIKHGAKRKKCSFSGCDKLSRQGGLCIKHGAKKPSRKKCSFSGCDKLSRGQGGVCIKHGAKRTVRIVPLSEICQFCEK